MNTKYRLLQFDYWIQKILGLSIIACSVTIIGIWLGGLGLILFGAVQVLSGLIFAIAYQDRKRWVYLLIVTAFFMFWYGTTKVGYDSPFYKVTQATGFFLIFVPPSLAIWYFRLTTAEYKDLKSQQNFKTFIDEQILDA